ncbi:hypothetical protein GCM10027162_61600 [Streptomyces incanus]
MAPALAPQSYPQAPSRADHGSIRYATGQGLVEADKAARECGVDNQDLLQALDRLTTIGFLQWWRSCPDTGDVQWSCASRT